MRFVFEKVSFASGYYADSTDEFITYHDVMVVVDEKQNYNVLSVIVDELAPSMYYVPGNIQVMTDILSRVKRMCELEKQLVE